MWIMNDKVFSFKFDRKGCEILLLALENLYDDLEDSYSLDARRYSTDFYDVKEMINLIENRLEVE